MLLVALVVAYMVEPVEQVMLQIQVAVEHSHMLVH